MPEFIRERLPQVEKACRQYHVEHLYVYGSAVTDDYKPGESDLDFMVDFAPTAWERYEGPSQHYLMGKPNPENRGLYSVNYRAFTVALEEIFAEVPKRRIDIGTYGCIDNTHFKRSVDALKVRLYG